MSFLSISVWQFSGCFYSADLAAYLQFWPAVPVTLQAFYMLPLLYQQEVPGDGCCFTTRQSRLSYLL